MRKKLRKIFYKMFLFRLFLFLWVVSFQGIFADIGIVVAVNDKYMEFALPSLMHLRSGLGCSLPIEVWHCGDELSEKNKQLLQNQISCLTIKDLAPLITEDPKHFQGYQIKGKILQHTQFDEILLIDADVYFYQNPETFFFHKGYLETGTFFFQDFPWMIFPRGKARSVKRYSIDYWNKRISFISKHIQEPSEYMPKNWQFYWDKTALLQKKRGLYFEHQESGCVFFNRKKHPKALEYIVQLNTDWKNTYQCVFGDKETFWIACEIAKEPYYVNPVRGYGFYGDCRQGFFNGSVFQFVDDTLIYQQKHVVYPENNCSFQQLFGEKPVVRPLLESECLAMQNISEYIDQVHGQFFPDLQRSLSKISNPKQMMPRNYYSGKKGIVLAVCDKYMKHTLASLLHLRKNLKCSLPIEIWHSGDELSQHNKHLLQKITHVHIRDIAPLVVQNVKYFRGYQIKGKMLQYSHFDEIILMDADVYFYKNPEILFQQSDYKKTGAFFFRDVMFLFPHKKGMNFHVIGSEEKYLHRKGFMQQKIQNPSKYMPKEWRHYWKDKIPDNKQPGLTEHQESGCVVFNRKTHAKSLQYIISLNESWKETFQYVGGDKETFWIGCEMAKEPYSFNPSCGYRMYSKTKEGHYKGGYGIMQFFQGEIFYQQKAFDPQSYAYAFLQYNSLSPERRAATQKELKKIKDLMFFRQKIVMTFFGKHAII